MARASLSCCGAAEARYITSSVLIAGPKAGGASHGKKRPNYGTREFGNKKKVDYEVSTAMIDKAIRDRYQEPNWGIMEYHEKSGRLRIKQPAKFADSDRSEYRINDRRSPKDRKRL